MAISMEYPAEECALTFSDFQWVWGGGYGGWCHMQRKKSDMKDNIKNFVF